MNADEQMHLLDNLQSLLEKQIELARKGNFRRVEALAEQDSFIVEKIVKIKPFGQPEFDGRRKHLLKLYKTSIHIKNPHPFLCNFYSHHVPNMIGTAHFADPHHVFINQWIMTWSILEALNMSKIKTFSESELMRPLSKK